MKIRKYDKDSYSKTDNGSGCEYSNAVLVGFWNKNQALLVDVKLNGLRRKDDAMERLGWYQKYHKKEARRLPGFLQ